MAEPVRRIPERFRVVLDSGEVIEHDGTTVPEEDGLEVPAVVLRLAPERAHSLAHVLSEWSGMSRLFTASDRPSLDEQELARNLETAAGAVSRRPLRCSVAGPVAPRPEARLSAVAELALREPRLSSVQRSAVVDAAAWLLENGDGGEDLAYALLEAVCSSPTATTDAYCALMALAGPVDARDLDASAGGW